MLESLLIGVLGSVIASAIFLATLYSLRPNLEFSKFIADQSKNDDHMFAFKIINRSRWALTHLEFELTLITPKSVHGGVVLTNDLLPLIKDKIFEIGKFDKKDKDAQYAVRIGAPVDLRAKCAGEGQFLYLTVSAQHSLSGFRKVFTKHYHPESDVKKGKHEYGLGLDVL
jgi:hypothetical protein